MKRRENQPGCLSSLWVIWLLLLVTGCSSTEYRYLPVEQQPNATRSRNEIIYAEPTNAPLGRVRISSLGLTDIERPPDGKKVQALHIRMAISHQGPTPWNFNAKDARILFPNRPPLAPFWLNSDDVHLPKVEIPPNILRAVDLYFALPSSLNSASDIPDFDFKWEIQAGDQKIEESTPFARVTLPPSMNTVYPYSPYPYGVGLGWGSVWWANPFFPGA